MDAEKKLYAALVALSNYQKAHRENPVIQGQYAIGETNTRLLLESGYLSQVIKGWYIPSRPGASGDSTIWFASYWNFMTKYLSSRFGDKWCLSPELSLYLHGGNTIIPGQLIVRSESGTNNVISLPFNNSVLDIRASVSAYPEIHHDTGMRVYPVDEALLMVGPDYFKRSRNEAAICLSLVTDESRILELVSDKGMSARGARLAGALRAAGKSDMADRIMSFMRRMGYFGAREVNPFAEALPSVSAYDNPYVARISIMWDKMKEDLLTSGVFDGIRPEKINKEELMSRIDDYYLLDSYHSLSIEGYVVSQALLDRVSRGDWSPDDNEADKNERNALAARGYYQAFGSVKESVGRILNGAPAGDVFASDFREWHYQLFEPAVRAGIMKASDLAGYRNHPVYIRGSLHTPVGAHAVSGCMEKLQDLMKKEIHPLIRAILGHFFFTYIHPYMDGNGRTARFSMNTQLVGAGYDWVVIPKEMRVRYMQSLEKASVQEDILEFGSFISSLLKNPLKPDKKEA